MPIKAKTTKKTKKVAANKKATAGKPTGLTVPVVNTQGAKAGTIKLQEQYFNAPVNAQLLAQAVRVYLANQRTGSASTKTRGEVEGSTRKIYRQKGTGRARHGAIRAPIFVGGGIVFGPRPRDYSRTLPEKMRKRALSSALTAQRNSGNMMVVDGLEDLEPKTKYVAAALDSIGASGRTLLVVGKDASGLVRATRNIRDVDVRPVRSLTTYDVVTHATVVFTKRAMQELNG